MQFRFLALLSLCAVASASVAGRHAAQPHPSATPPSYSCPEMNASSHGKVSELSDSPPHKGTLFGCTSDVVGALLRSSAYVEFCSYRTGTGTGTHSCTYNSKTGECNSRDSRCPSKATYTRSHKRRDEYSF
ncbi:hypothetical protein B0H19DRAFT_1259916 [Mycena capillaripes]|nr:hypothetical protein B0H19DRAFT_1259916 [Mycena capillaripes]